MYFLLAGIYIPMSSKRCPEIPPRWGYTYLRSSVIPLSVWTQEHGHWDALQMNRAMNMNHNKHDPASDVCTYLCSHNLMAYVQHAYFMMMNCIQAAARMHRSWGWGWDEVKKRETLGRSGIAHDLLSFLAAFLQSPQQGSRHYESRRKRCVKPRIRDIFFSTSCCKYLLPAAFLCARAVRPYLDHGVASRLRLDAKFFIK
jgi:hypothetical protein